MSNKKFNIKVEDSTLKMGLDLNQDGQNMVGLNVNLSEAVQEILNRGEAVEGVKIVDFKFDLTSLKLKLDTDKDGEELLELNIDLSEVFDEIQTAIKQAKEKK